MCEGGGEQGGYASTSSWKACILNHEGRFLCFPFFVLVLVSMFHVSSITASFIPHRGVAPHSIILHWHRHIVIVIVIITSLVVHFSFLFSGFVGHSFFFARLVWNYHYNHTSSLVSSSSLLLLLIVIEIQIVFTASEGMYFDDSVLDDVSYYILTDS